MEGLRQLSKNVVGDDIDVRPLDLSCTRLSDGHLFRCLVEAVSELIDLTCLPDGFATHGSWNGQSVQCRVPQPGMPKL